MPVIELHSTGAAVGQAVEKGLDVYFKAAALQERRAQNEYRNKLLAKQMEWAEEDRELERKQRESASAFAGLQLSGFASPAAIEAEKSSQITEAGRTGFVGGAQGAVPGSIGFLRGGLLGVQENIEQELPGIEAEAGRRTERLAGLLEGMSPGARALAQKDFDTEEAQLAGGAAQRDVSRALRAVLRRNKMPGQEEWLGSLIRAVDTWNPETGEGLAPWDAETQFRSFFKEWNDDQTDMRIIEAGGQRLGAMAAAMGIADNPAVVAALQGYVSGGMRYGETARLIIGQTPEGEGLTKERKAVADAELAERKLADYGKLTATQRAGILKEATADVADMPGWSVKDTPKVGGDKPGIGTGDYTRADVSAWKAQRDALIQERFDARVAVVAGTGSTAPARNGFARQRGVPHKSESKRVFYERARAEGMNKAAAVAAWNKAHP